VRNNVLIVEDQKIVAADLESTLSSLGYVIAGAAASGEEAIAKAGSLHPDLVLMDIRLRGQMDGVEAAQTIIDRFDVPVVYLTAYVDEETIGRAKATGASGYVVKPYNERELRAAIEVALHKHELDKLLSEERARRRTAELEQERAAALAQLGAALASSLDSQVILRRVARMPLPLLGDACLIMSATSPGALEQVAEAGLPIERAAELRSLRDVPLPPRVVAMLREVITSGRASHFEDFARWLERAAEPSRYLEVMKELPARSLVVAPIVVRGEGLGALLFIRASLAKDHTASDVSLAEEIGQLIGLSLENARLYREAREAAQTFRALVEGVKEYAIFKVDPKGYVTTWNAGAERIEGYTAAEIIGHPRSLFYTPEDVARGRPEATLGTATTAGRAEFDGWFVRKDGSHFWANAVISPLRDEGGFLVGFAEVTRDLSEQKRASDVQRVLDQATVALSSSLDIGETLDRAVHFLVPELGDWCLVDLVDDEGHLVQVAAGHLDRQLEARARRLTRDSASRDVPLPHGPEHAVRTEATEVVPRLDDPPAIPAPLDADHPELFRALGVLSYVCAPIQFRGKTLGVISFLRGAGCRRYVAADVIVAEDLARRAGLAIANARSFQDAQEAIRMRDEFLQVASHELRTPLTPMQLQLDALGRALERSGMKGEQLTTKLDTFNRQLGRLSKLVETLLDVSRIAAGRLTLQLEELDFVDIARDVVERFREELRRAGSEVAFRSEGPIMGRWDRLRVEQILSNLLSNAAKYGAGKPMEVDVRASNGTVRLDVVDRGIGIDKEAIGRIFGRFERGVSVRHYGGLGLGLYIARQIAEAHGGTILARSQIGEGSTFTVVLPRQPVSHLRSEDLVEPVSSSRAAS
jgi:PAS domain S-box-containing protein